ncbi:hypothetical protein ACG873_03840 [Mesorhizobium sp. AaZ16]
MQLPETTPPDLIFSALPILFLVSAMGVWFHGAWKNEIPPDSGVAIEFDDGATFGDGISTVAQVFKKPVRAVGFSSNEIDASLEQRSITVSGYAEGILALGSMTRPNSIGPYQVSEVGGVIVVTREGTK